jgi:hypothetical protein
MAKQLIDEVYISQSVKPQPIKSAADNSLLSQLGLDESYPEGAAFDVAVGLYQYLSDYHGGQNSPEYSALSQMGSDLIFFNPGMGGGFDTDGEPHPSGEDESARMVYDYCRSGNWQEVFNWLESYCGSEEGGEGTDGLDDGTDGLDETGLPLNQSFEDEFRGMPHMPGIEADLPQVPGDSTTAPATDPFAGARNFLTDMGVPEDAITTKKRFLDVDLSHTPELTADAETFLQQLQETGAKGILFPDSETLRVMVMSAASPYQGTPAGAGGEDPKTKVLNRWPAIYRHLDRLKVNGIRLSKPETLQSLERRFPDLGPEGAKEAYYQFYMVHQGLSLRKSQAIMQSQMIQSEEEAVSDDPQSEQSDPEIPLS